MEDRTTKDVHAEVRGHYGKVARGESCETGCFGGAPCKTNAALLGYSDAERSAAPLGSDMGLGCGNPQTTASPRVGETVLDLGSGGGFDAFLAARQVGPAGKVDRRRHDRGHSFQAGREPFGFSGDRERSSIHDPSKPEIVGLRTDLGQSRGNPRASALADLYRRAAALVDAGDIAGARALHEAIGRLLGDERAIRADVIDLNEKRRP
jgi:hypothetical protein